jgi:N-acetylmuramoyl-L-alanine amidase
MMLRHDSRPNARHGTASGATMLARGIAALILCGCLAGCGTSRTAKKVTPVSPSPALPPGQPSAPTLVIPVETPQPPAPTLPAPPPPASVAIPSTNWISLRAWLAENPSPQLHVRAGTRRIDLNGVGNLLAFEPVQRNGDLLLHPIDVAKNLAPLRAAPTPWSRRSIVVDPGHGGGNAGTRALTGNQFEKELTLDWALRLKPLLEARGWTVLLTRTNDVEMSLAERVDFAEASGAAVFISLHFNSVFPQQTAQGLETYCLTPTGLPSTITREYVDDPAASFPNNRHDADNLRLAMRIQASILTTTKAADRSVRRARFMDVLRWQNRPAVLVEGGYLSNPAESRAICTPHYRQLLALGVARAFE